jgi:L-lactate dehydrogenase complex protein LldG
MVMRELEARFVAAAEAAGAEVLNASDLSAAFSTVARFLDKEKTKKVAASVRVLKAGCADRLLVSTPRNPQEFGQARVGLVWADYGVAETGTLVHMDESDEERMLWTLPATSLCLLERGRVVPDLEALAAVINEHLSRPGTPGPQVSLVTGPSRTADIEGQLTIGVQGPARLVIILFDGQGV